MLLSHAFFCFFFQAEDGIRDWSVTGVQTCALPICAARLLDRRLEVLANLARLRLDVADPGDGAVGAARRHPGDEHELPGGADRVGEEIGRASCRERV